MTLMPLNGADQDARRAAYVAACRDGRQGLFATALSVSILLPFACSPDRIASSAPRFPGASVVLVSIDTLRSDRLPMYGYAGVATPALDAFRRDAILFERAYAHVPLTLPSHVSIFTGLEPGRHGVLSNGGYTLGEGEPTLAGLLKKAGYRTGAAVSSAVLSGRSGIGRGFDLWEDRLGGGRPGAAPEFVERPGAETAALLLKWIRAQEGQRFFAFLHTYEPHAPYAAPEPFRSRYADPYDGEVAASDAIVGGFLDELKRAGIYDDALVILLSDHGEGLGDHGEKQHGIFVYREALQVPLAIKLPGNAFGGRSVAAPVQLSDVFATVGELLGVAAFPERPGTFPLGRLAAGAPAPDRRVFAENHSPRIRLGWSELRALVSERYYYIDAPRPELYAATDAAQRTNLVDQRPPELRSLVVEVEKRRTALRAPAPVDAETAAKLRSLGYLTGTARDDGPRPDPKDVIGSFARLESATELHQAGRSAEALPLLVQVVAESPSLVDAWEVLAAVYERLGRLDEALSALRNAVAFSPPGRSRLVAEVAALALRAGRLDEARRNAELARDFGDPRAWVVLGRIALREGKYDEALRLAARALAVPGAAPAAGIHVVRAEAYGRKGELALAERAYREELEAHPGSVEALTGLAVVAATRGEIDEAVRRVKALVGAVPTVEGYLAGVVSLESFRLTNEARSLLAEGRRAFPEDPRLARLETAGGAAGHR